MLGVYWDSAGKSRGDRFTPAFSMRDMMGKMLRKTQDEKNPLGSPVKSKMVSSKPSYHLVN